MSLANDSRSSQPSARVRKDASLTSSILRLDHTNPLLVATATGITLATAYAAWSRFMRRIPNVDALTQSYLDGRKLRGVVTSVGDADNFRFYHKPLLSLGKVPTSRAELKDQTIHVRLAGVDAPELAHFGQPAQPFSAEALDKQALTELVHKRVVHVRLYRKDRYGRVVGMAFVRRPPWPWRVNVSEQMLKAGLATVYTQGGAEYAGLLSRFEKLEAIAKSRRPDMVCRIAVTEATKYLKSTSWRLDAAIDAFFNSSAPSGRAPGSASTVSVRNLEQLWKQYAGSLRASPPSSHNYLTCTNRSTDPSVPDEMSIDGTLSYCQDLQVEPEDPVMLAVACITKAPTMGRFSKQGWIEAWKDARKDTIDGQKSHINTLRSNMEQPDFFRRVYNFTFDYAKNEGQKSLQYETACDLWNLLIPLDPASTFPDEHLQWWQQFLAEKGSKAVSRDTWNLFLEFVRTIDSSFEKYDEEGAYRGSPGLIETALTWTLVSFALM
ncbi:Scaffold-type E3 ligase [Microbotryomycetes sp. JL201]|nr:Scaffold-type E3 ligase [Microbotryomycetes sp. JL201]